MLRRDGWTARRSRTLRAVLGLAAVLGLLVLAGSGLAEASDEDGERAIRGAGDGAAATDTGPACATGVEAHAREGGVIEVTWNASEDADAYRVYRAGDDGELAHVATVEDTRFVDDQTAASVVYAYRVTTTPEADPAACSAVATTAIPTFPAAIALGVAALGGAGAVVSVRRR